MLGLALGGALALGAVGCADPKVALNEGARQYVAADYPEVLERWTREKSLLVLSELDELLTVTATYQSWDFRWAYAVRYAEDYRLTVEQRRDLLAKTTAESRDEHLFYVALYGSRFRWTDLTRADSAWIVRLVDDQGNETAPATIELITRPGPLERRYFPYTTVWRQAFRIRFPAKLPDGRATVDPKATWLGLRFAGPEGNQELRWEVTR